MGVHGTVCLVCCMTDIDVEWKLYLLGSSCKGQGSCVWWTTLSVHVTTERNAKGNYNVIHVPCKGLRGTQYTCTCNCIVNFYCTFLRGMFYGPFGSYGKLNKTKTLTYTALSTRETASVIFFISLRTETACSSALLVKLHAEIETHYHNRNPDFSYSLLIFVNND